MGKGEQMCETVENTFCNNKKSYLEENKAV
jgi:hypothetical protein